MEELLRRIQRLEKTENVTMPASSASPAMAKSTKKPRNNKTKSQKEQKLVAAATRARSDSNIFGVLRADSGTPPAEELVGHSLFGPPSTPYTDFRDDMMQHMNQLSSEKLISAKESFIEAMQPCQTLFDEMVRVRETALAAHPDATRAMDLMCKHMSVGGIMDIANCHSQVLDGAMTATELNAELYRTNFDEFERLRRDTGDQISAHDNVCKQSHGLTLSLSLKAAHITLTLYKAIASKCDTEDSELTELCKCNESHMNIINEFVKRTGELACALHMPEVKQCCSGHLPRLFVELAKDS